MPRRGRRTCGRLCGNRRPCWLRRYRRTHRRLGNRWTGRSRDLRRLRGRNNDGLWNHCGRRSNRRFRFDGTRSRCGWAARLRNYRGGWRRDRSGRGRGSYDGWLHSSSPGGCFFRCFIRYRLLFGLRLGFGDCAKMLAHLYCSFHIDRTGVRFFLGNPGFGQIVNDSLCLDLELASQFVDSDLIRIGHCPPGPLLFPVLFV